MKISFDFDGTIANNTQLQELAKILLIQGSEVFILTSRNHDNQKIVKEVVDLGNELGIKRENIIFSPFTPKLDHIKNLNIDLHFDDDEIDIEQINQELPWRGMLVAFEKFPKINEEDTI